MTAAVTAVWRAVSSWLLVNARELVFVLGLALVHVGLRAVDSWAPGAAYSVPGGVLLAVAIFGVRGGAAPERGRWRKSSTHAGAPPQ